MRPARALALMALLGLVGAWTTSGPPPPAPFQLHAVPPLLGPPSQSPTTTTTVAARIIPPARIRPIRASRGVPRPVVTETAPGAYSGGIPPIMLRIRFCESRDNYTAQNRRSTASGAWQFLDSSWANYAGYPRAYLAPPAVQDQKAMNVYNAVGTRPWNASRSCWS